MCKNWMFAFLAVLCLALFANTSLAQNCKNGQCQLQGGTFVPGQFGFILPQGGCQGPSCKNGSCVGGSCPKGSCNGGSCSGTVVPRQYSAGGCQGGSCSSGRPRLLGRIFGRR